MQYMSPDEGSFEKTNESLLILLLSNIVNQFVSLFFTTAIFFGNNLIDQKPLWRFAYGLSILVTEIEQFIQGLPNVFLVIHL